MRIAVSGATGAIGRRLVPFLVERGHEVRALTRDAEAAKGRLPETATLREYDPYDTSSVQEAIDGCDAVVHLAGENIFGARWTKRRRETIRTSRVITTRVLVQAMHEMKKRPQTFVCMSAVGFYGPREPHETVDEGTLDADSFAPEDFLAWVCRQWEAAAREAERLGVRTVRLRAGVVLMRGDGALAQMEPIFRKNLGGKIASGEQGMSWIHVDDLLALMLFVLESPQVDGPVNATAPRPVSNAEFSRALANALGKSSWLTVPGFALRLRFGGAAGVLTTGQRVVPTRALQHGFRFRHDTVDAALAALYADEQRKKTQARPSAA
jgi:uncharacterized protein (TIGR01777 family)